VYTSDKLQSVFDYENCLDMILDEIESLTTGAFFLAESAGIHDPLMAKCHILVHIAMLRAEEAKELRAGLWEMHKQEIDAASKQLVKTEGGKEEEK
jgi:hypothetical protein